MEIMIGVIVVAIIIIACVFANKLTSKLGVPVLLAFLFLGMIFGSDGFFKIPFDNYGFTEQICTVALIFIIFYGGFGTNWREAKPVAVRSLFLSSVGVVITAGLTGIFCHFVLKIDWMMSLLLGAVLSCTDATSVFNILRSKKLGLKYGTASMLELESGSNDPWAYMLTVVLISLVKTGGEIDVWSVVYMFFAQIVYGAAIGVVIAILGVLALKYIRFVGEQFDCLFLVAVALLAYAVPDVLGGNGYLSVYIVGIILGNVKLKNKKGMVNFFDAITGLLQMLIFFILGLLSNPSQMPQVLIPALCIFVFLTFIARPLATMGILSAFRSKLKQQILVSWAGLRGATSIVFAILVIVSNTYIKDDFFNIVFCIVLLSVGIQGTLLPFLSKKLNMIDKNENVMKTFTDYSNESNVKFISVEISLNHKWAGQKIKNITLPPQTRIVLIKRNSENVIPVGKTVLQSGDVLILSTTGVKTEANVNLKEIELDSKNKWCGKRLCEIKFDSCIVVLIKRGNISFVPVGQTRLHENDTVVVIDE